MSSYVNLSTAELENLLRRTDVPAHEQQAIEQELSRRYTSEYLEQGGPPAPPPFAPRQMQPATPPAPPPFGRQEWRPPVAPVPAAPPGKSSTGSKAVGWFVALVIAVVIGVLFSLYEDSGDPTPTSGTVCVIPGGDYCPLSVGLPKGAACVCTDGVTTLNGVVG